MPLIFTLKPDSFTRLGVWHLTEHVHELAEKLPLGDRDQIRFSAIRNESRKKQWLGCRKVLYELINHAEMDIRYDSFGKPRLHCSPVYISFSHSGFYASAILSEKGPAGIDIEQKKSRIFRVSDHFLHEEEKHRMGAENQLEKSYIHWCSKEAVIKLTGFTDIDLRNDIRVESFDYLCSGSVFLQVNHHGKTGKYQANYHDMEDYMLVYVVETL